MVVKEKSDRKKYIYKNKQLNNTQVLKIKDSTLELANDFNPFNISINIADKFEKKTNKEESIYKKHLV